MNEKFPAADGESNQLSQENRIDQEFGVAESRWFKDYQEGQMRDLSSDPNNPDQKSYVEYLSEIKSQLDMITHPRLLDRSIARDPSLKNLRLAL